MATSKDFRQRAWDSLKNRYWMAVLVSTAATMIASVGVVSSNPSTIFPDASLLVELGMMTVETAATVTTAVTVISIVMWLASAAYSVFVVGPLEIGLTRYYITNTQEQPAFSVLFSGFKSNYMNGVKIMFFRLGKLMLWGLLFIVPAIIKSYEYAMVPYIVAENPEISSSVAFALSKKMMDGNKWRLFKLEFSFIGWHLLALCTCGLGSFFLEPYTHAARTEFYKELSTQA